MPFFPVLAPVTFSPRSICFPSPVAGFIFSCVLHFLYNFSFVGMSDSVLKAFFVYLTQYCAAQWKDDQRKCLVFYSYNVFGLHDHVYLSSFTGCTYSATVTCLIAPGSVCMLACACHRSHFFPHFLRDACFPAFGTCYMFFCACQEMHGFPPLAPGKLTFSRGCHRPVYSLALYNGCMFFRAWHFMQFPFIAIEFLY